MEAPGARAGVQGGASKREEPGPQDGSYKKGGSQTNIEIRKDDDFSKILAQEEAYIKKICDVIPAFKQGLVSPEKGAPTWPTPS